MYLIPPSRCPRCGSGLPLAVLWEFARLNDSHVLPGLNLLTSSGLLRGRVGIECPNCRANLRVVQTRIREIRAISWIMLLGGAWYLGEWSRANHVPLDPRISGSVVMAAVAWIFYFERKFTPRLAQVRLDTDPERLIFPLRSAYEGSQGGDAG